MPEEDAGHRKALHKPVILNYKRLCPSVCVSVRLCVTLDWIISDLNTPSQGSDTDINI